MSQQEDFKLTKEEALRFQEAFKKEEFKTMFFDYMKELADPAQKKKYELEIAQLEKERGNDVEFVHPCPGFVVKCSFIKIPTSTSSHRPRSNKVFINICSNEKIETASGTSDTRQSSRGVSWKLPYSLSPPNDSLDKEQRICTVYDCVFHPDTLKLAEINSRMKLLLVESAVEGIEKEFHVALNRTFRYPKMTYKGVPRPTVIRKKITGFTKKEETSTEFIEKLVASQNNRTKPSLNEPKGVETPRYSLIFSKAFDTADYTNEKERHQIHNVDNLVLRILLPRMNRSNEAELDVTESKLILDVSKKYHLELDLPRRVNHDMGQANFDVDSKTLVITLPVVIE